MAIKPVFDKRVMKKQYVFYFHYNKPASIKAGKPQLTVHYQKTCFLVDAVDVRVS